MTYSFHLLLPQLTCSTVVVGIASNLKLSLFAYSPYLSPSPLLLFLLLLIFILIHPYTPYLPCHYPIPRPLSHRPPLLTRSNRSLECVGCPRNALHRLSRTHCTLGFPIFLPSPSPVRRVSPTSHTVASLTNVVYCALTQVCISDTLGPPFLFIFRHKFGLRMFFCNIEPQNTHCGV